MRTIAVMNQKGGVGKTTTTVNLGATLAELGKRVLLVDLDPQAHLTIGFGIEPVRGGGGASGGGREGGEDRVSLYNVLVEERPLLEAIQAVDARISLVPSSIDLAAAEIELVSILGRETLLKKRVEAAKAAGGLAFDYVLLDCPPSLGLLTLNALAVADEVIVPMQPQFLPLQGMAKLLETVQLVNRRMNPALKVSGIVLTMFDSQTKLSNEVVAELSGFIEQAKGQPLPWSEAVLFRTKIRRNIKLAESPSFGQNILKYDPASNGASDYRSLAKEVVAMSEPAAAEPEPASAPTEAGVVDAPPAAAAPAGPVPVPASQPVATAAPPELGVPVNRGVDPTQLAAAKADFAAAKAEIAAARARIAAAKKKKPADPAAPIAEAEPRDTEAVA